MTVTRLRPVAHILDSPCRATVVAVTPDQTVEVSTTNGHRFCCEVLSTGVGALNLQQGDRVVALPPDGPEGLGCILGVVGTPRPPNVLRVRAGEELHLECGKGAIHLRADGTVVVRGLDVASIASGCNRIKGGTVELN